MPRACRDVFTSLRPGLPAHGWRRGIAVLSAKSPSIPYIRLLGAQLAIGAAAIFARYALLGAGALAVSALRLSIGALAVVLIVRRLQAIPLRRELAFALAGALLALHFGTWISSLSYTSVAVSTLLVTTTPLWTECYDLVRERRGPSGAFSLSLLLAVAGVTALVFSRSAAPPPVPGFGAEGVALALAGSFSIGAYLLVVRDAAALPGGELLPTGQIVARTYTWAAVALAVAAALGGQLPPALTNVPAWGGILAMALVSQLLGHTALNAALRDFSPSTIALTTLLEPVIAALLAAALFGETLGLQGFAGGALVLAAVAVALRSAERRPAGYAQVPPATGAP